MKKAAVRCSCCAMHDMADNGMCPHCDRPCLVPADPRTGQPTCPACIEARRIVKETP